MLDELSRNLRLRLGLVAIVAILALYGLLEWRDHLALASADYRRLLGQVARLQQPQQAELWAPRASEAQRALEHARATLWRNSSTGLAQAQVQDRLSRLLRQTDAKQPSLRVTEPDASLEVQALVARLPAELRDGDRLRPLRARVEFNSDPAVLLALLAALNDSPQLVGIDGLTVKGFRTELVLNFWFEIVPEVKP